MNHHYGQLQPVQNAIITNVKLDNENGKYHFGNQDVLSQSHIHGLVIRANAGYSFSDDGDPLTAAAAMESMFLSLWVGTTNVVKIPVVHLLKENIDHLYVEVDLGCIDFQKSGIVIEDEGAFDNTRTDFLTIGEVVEVTWFYHYK